jgi:hypothetical protein
MPLYYSVSFLFGVILFSRPNFAEHSVLHFERVKICRTGKCSAEWEAFRNLSELDNVAPNTTTLYLMIFCEGELRNGTKYAKLAYLLLISGNYGIQKRMA